MHEHSDFYELFVRFWWLAFPLFWAIGAMLKNIFRHHRASDALTLLKAYAEQGKEPPPELLAVLRQPEQAEERKSRVGGYRHYGWVPVFLFGALACGFVLMAIFPPDDHIPVAAMPFGALIMLGLCIGHLVAMLAYNRDQDRNRPQ